VLGPPHQPADAEEQHQKRNQDQPLFHKGQILIINYLSGNTGYSTFQPFVCHKLPCNAFATHGDSGS
jgi:hypothetical protein